MCNMITEMLKIAERAYAPLARVTEDEQDLTTELVRGYYVVEVIGKWYFTRDTPQI
jgi:hypothetical protein